MDTMVEIFPFSELLETLVYDFLLVKETDYEF